MSEEKHNLQHQADRAKPGSKRSVMTYLAIMFAAAFVLLLLAYFMQQRNNEETIDGLKESVSAMQSAQDLYEENSELKTQLQELQEQVDSLTSQVDTLTQDNSQLSGALENTSAAMDWFWQIDEAYVRGRYALCRELIESLQAAGLEDSLPKESVTDNERFSPADRYQEIYEALY